MTELLPPVLDAETKVSERPHQQELRLWLRLLTCTNLVEALVRTRLRTQFDATLPRFDLLAQLEKAPDGLTLGELSRRMMVSNGNVTGLVQRLEEQGQVVRAPHPTDRRAARVRLTADGRRAFGVMADAHQGWIREAFAGLDPGDGPALMEALARMKVSVRKVTP